jgi:hypothetical protein
VKRGKKGREDKETCGEGMCDPREGRISMDDGLNHGSYF